MPGYAKGGPVKKDGYLTDKKGKPYARVHKGERVVPKEKKAFASYMDKVYRNMIIEMNKFIKQQRHLSPE